MRFVALVFPRLAVQLARKANPELIGKPFGLLSGTGDAGILSVVSVESTAAGIEAGMTSLQARQRCPRIVIEADNPTQCLEALDAVVSIVRTRATSNVAIVSREAIVVELSGTELQFAGEAAAAQGLLALARSWSGLDVRAAVASSISEALCKARTARRHPVICEPRDVESGEQLHAYEPVAASFSWEKPADCGHCLNQNRTDAWLAGHGALRLRTQLPAGSARIGTWTVPPNGCGASVDSDPLLR